MQLVQNTDDNREWWIIGAAGKRKVGEAEADAYYRAGVSKARDGLSAVQLAEIRTVPD